MINRNPGKEPDEVELQRMRTLAEAGDFEAGFALRGSVG